MGPGNHGPYAKATHLAGQTTPPNWGNLKKGRSQIKQFEKNLSETDQEINKKQRETGGFMTQLSQRHEDLPSL